MTILQFRENLSDRQAADAVRGRIDWKYLLSLKLTDAGFDFSVLSEFRRRLLEGGQEAILLEKLLECCQAQGLIKARGKQRTDATRVLAAIRVLTRLELLGETMRAALNELATVVPDWLAESHRKNGIKGTPDASKTIACLRAMRNELPMPRRLEKTDFCSWTCCKVMMYQRDWTVCQG